MDIPAVKTALATHARTGIHQVTLGRMSLIAAYAESGMAAAIGLVMTGCVDALRRKSIFCLASFEGKPS
jgi:hypothetical protein